MKVKKKVIIEGKEHEVEIEVEELDGFDATKKELDDLKKKKEKEAKKEESDEKETDKIKKLLNNQPDAVKKVIWLKLHIIYMSVELLKPVEEQNTAQLNALNKATISEINSALNQIQHNNNIRVLIITGSGDKAFVAGADIKEFIHFTPEEGKALAKNGQDLLFDTIANFSKPVIAAINGYALGGGLELALACHVRLASENAKMGLPEVTLGLIPGYGGTQRLAQLVGKGKALMPARADG